MTFDAKSSLSNLQGLVTGLALLFESGMGREAIYRRLIPPYGAESPRAEHHVPSAANRNHNKQQHDRG